METKFCIRCRYAALLVGTVLIVLGEADATVITARSAAFVDVSTAVSAASDGDTVIVPGGTATWSTTLAVKKGITIQGATTTDTAAGTVNDETIIVDNVSPRGPIISATMAPTQSLRLTGFTFRPGTSTAFGTTGGIHLDGTCPSIRVDHCHFDQLYQAPVIHTFGWIYGVADHSIFDCRGASFSFLIWHNTWGNKSNGDGSWAEPSYWGSEKFFFIEDNLIRNVVANGAQTNACIDAKMGARYVARYNKFYNTVGPNSHGTEGAPQRGVRAVDSYKNTFNWSFSAGAGQIRGGCVLFHDNTYTGVKLGTPTFWLTDYREFNPFIGFGGAHGGNPWDLNDKSAPNGGVIPLGQTTKDPGLYATGKHTGPNNSPSLIVSGAGWTANQWVGYEVTNLDQPHNSSIPYNNAYVVSNTSNTITFPPNTTPTFQPALAFNTGDRFEIRKVIAAIDQIGRGKGDLISSTSTPRWPNQESDPVYAWNNKQMPANTNVNVGSGYPSIQENRDFFNTSKSGYISYVYPHPLVSGAPTPAPTIAPPSNLTIIAGP